MGSGGPADGRVSIEKPPNRRIRRGTGARSHPATLILTAAPALCVQLWDAVQAGDHKQALMLHEKLLPLWNAIFHDNLPANVKYCMELTGRPAGFPRAPMPPTSEVQQPRIQAALRNAGLL